jgi:very-short-patch-repair endonuclease
MKIIDNNIKSLKEKRKYLRNNITKPETILWRYLRKKQILGARFRRQFSLDKFIVDFYCHDLNWQ